MHPQTPTAAGWWLRLLVWWAACAVRLVNRAKLSAPRPTVDSRHAPGRTNGLEVIGIGVAHAHSFVGQPFARGQRQISGHTFSVGTMPQGKHALREAPAMTTQEAQRVTSPEWWTPPWSPGSPNDPDVGWTSGETGPGSPNEWNAAKSNGKKPSPLQERFGQVRSRSRVRELAEVFTNQREVDAMLDLVADAFAELDIKFLEPSCGSGNFLVEILRRKLTLVSARRCHSQEHFEHRMLRAVASIYGVDISPDNVTESRVRMAQVLVTHYQSETTASPTSGFLDAAELMLDTNIVLFDMLAPANELELCDWKPGAKASFQRVWSPALVPPSERDLFWAERIEDEEPVHFSDLTGKQGK